LPKFENESFSDDSIEYELPSREKDEGGGVKNKKAREVDEEGSIKQ